MDKKRLQTIDQLFAKVATDIAYNAVIGPSSDHMDESEKRILAKLNEHMMPVIDELVDEIAQALEMVSYANRVVGSVETMRDEFKELSEAQHKFIEKIKLAARNYQAWTHGERLFYDDRERMWNADWDEYCKSLQATGKCVGCKQELNYEPGGWIPPLCENPECVNVILRKLTEPNSQVVAGQPADDESRNHNHASHK